MCCLSVVSLFRPMSLYCFALLHLPYVLGSSAVDLLLCRSWNFAFWILQNIFYLFFQLLKTSLKLRKRYFDWPMFFVGSINKIFIFSVKKKTSNSFVGSEPPKLRWSPYIFLNKLCLVFFQLLKTSSNWEFFCWLTNKRFIFSAKSKRKKTDRWYFVLKQIFGDPRNFGGSDATIELMIMYLDLHTKYQLQHLWLVGNF